MVIQVHVAGAAVHSPLAAFATQEPPMPRPRASHPRPLPGNVGARRGITPTSRQVASLPGSQIANRAARPGVVEWPSFR